MAKLLLVEDDTNLSEIYKARMEAEGYTVVAAPDGESALALAAKEKPDLIISDVMMPKISGFEMLDILRNTEGLKHTRVIMLTALGQAEDRARAEQLGADKYLVKSQVTLEDIVSAAHELLDDPVPGAVPAPPAAPAPVPASPVPAPVQAAPDRSAPTGPLQATAPAQPPAAPAPAAVPEPTTPTPTPAPAPPAQIAVAEPPSEPALTPALPQEQPAAPVTTPAPAQPPAAPAPAAVPEPTTPTTPTPTPTPMPVVMEPLIEPLPAADSSEATTPTDEPATVPLPQPTPPEPTIVEAPVTTPVAVHDEPVTTASVPPTVEAEAPAPVPPLPVTAPPEPVAPVPPPASVTPASIDEKVVANAIDKLLAKTSPPPADIVPPSASGNAQAGGTSTGDKAELPHTANNDHSAHGKIIRPIDGPIKPSLEELLAKEEAIEASGTTVSAADAPNSAGQQPGSSIDPNSIAL